jgi:Carboxypeptidase regulatory-like domain/TonB dependent receptor-like, beta-barrel
MKMAYWRMVSRMAVYALAAGTLYGQLNVSTLRGTATDATGAAVPDVTVQVVNVGTNVSRSVKTNVTGDYEIPDLQLGIYRLSAEMSGFKTFVAENIILESNQVRRVDIRLELGQLATEVSVRADAAVIHTESARIQTGFQHERYDNFPSVSNYFDPNTMLATLPNVQSPAGGYSVRFAGQLPSQIQEGMDGATNDGIVNQINNMEDMQDLQAVMVNASAEFSRVGNFNMVTKSGTNAIHGLLSYYQENSALNARNFFAEEKTRTLLHTFGGSIGGPIRKDKTFFYSSYQGMRVPSNSFTLSTVPTLKMREGDFSQLLTLPEPLIIKDPLTGLPFPGNQIPSNRLNPTSIKVRDQYIPSPNQGGPDALNRNFGFLFRYPSDLFRADYITTRIDHTLSSKNTLTGRYVTNWFFYVLPGSFPGLDWTRKRHNHHLVVSDTHVASPNLVNTALVGFYQELIHDGEEVDGYQPPTGDQVVAEIGLQGVNPKGLQAQGFPRMNITGFPSLSVQPGGFIHDGKFWTFKDSLSWNKGRHTWKFGGELRVFTDFNGSVPEGTYGVFAFDGTLSAHPFADFLLGLPLSSQRLDPLTNRDMSGYELGFFIQDAYKITNKLTLDYGLRWDRFGSASFKDELQYNWDPVSGDVIVPNGKLSAISPLYPTSTIRVVEGQVVPDPENGNFAPRLGAAYRLTGNTVLRGGYGIYNEALGAFARAQGTGPFQISETFFNSISGGQPLFAFPNPFPAGSGRIPSQSVSGYPLNTRNGQIHQFNVTIEHQLRDIGFRLSYIGSRARNLNYNLSTNKPQPSNIAFAQSRRPFPQFVNTSFARTDGATNYDSMSLEVQRRFASDITFQGHWTWAHNMANFLNLQNPYDPLHWNRDGFTPRHRISVNAIWNLPFGHGKRVGASVPSALDHIIGGWTLYYLAYFQTGLFFSPSFSGSDPSGTNTFGGLPDRLRNGNMEPDERTIDRWFDVSAFSPPPLGRFGDSGVNILEGPGLQVHHMSFSKRFNITERWKFQFLLAMSNVFNQTNFDFPSANISVPGAAGVIDCTYSCDDLFNLEKAGPRRMEVRLRLEF